VFRAVIICSCDDNGGVLASRSSSRFAAIAEARFMTCSSRILVVDDFADWRRFVRLTLQKHLELRIVAEVADGAEAVQKAQELQPDLIVLDISLPTMNGIEVAKRIGLQVPNAKILFFSETRSWDVVQEALRLGVGFVPMRERNYCRPLKPRSKGNALLVLLSLHGMLMNMTARFPRLIKLRS
jgi:CheY-like chemotaxis protein